MKKGILFCLSIATAVFFAACGDDPSSSNNANPAQENILPEETVNYSSSVKAISVSSSGKKEDTPVYTVETGSVIDERDGQIYKTVTIGTQTWLAQNLNYETVNSFCYNDTASYCDKYGRLYTWDAAMDACPSGWHLPSQTEWNTLLNTVGGNASTERKNSERLRSTLGWIKGNGTDAFSFSTLSAGGRGRNGDYGGEGHHADFWSSTEDRSVDAYIMRLNIYSVQLISEHKVNGYSVRCLKGDVPVQTQESSSSETAISSSSVKSSSSVVAIYDSTDTLIDSRDGQTYKTVTIGSQTWMAENLNYEKGGSFCYKDSVSYCANYGRLYTWEATEKACPSGYHLPNKMEWQQLIDAVGGTLTAGKMLKSKSGWRKKGDGSDGNGTDNFSFTALPVGEKLSNKKGDYVYESETTTFWSSSDLECSGSTDNCAYTMSLFYGDDYVTLDYDHQNRGYSVRCLKNGGSSSSSSQVVKSSSSENSSKDKGDRMFYLPTLIQACAYANLGNARFIECKSPNAIDCLQKINGCNFDAVEYCGCWESEDAYIYYRNKDKGQIR